MSKKGVANENLIKLRELSEKLCEIRDDEYKDIVKKLKSIVDNGKQAINESMNAQAKIKCYETMCSDITNILSTVKFK